MMTMMDLQLWMGVAEVEHGTEVDVSDVRVTRYLEARIWQPELLYLDLGISVWLRG